MRLLRFALPAIAIAAALLTPTLASAADCTSTHLRPSAKNAIKVRAATLCLLNRQRARHGLPSLHSHRSLQRAATSYARQMVRAGFFDHVSPSGSTMTQRIARTSYLHGVRSWSIGENLGWGAGSSATPASMVSAWMRSPGHRANILDRGFREIGIGLASGAPSRGGAASAAATYATEFGVRRR